MDPELADLLPLFISEVVPVRNEDGAIVDLEWVYANRLMNEALVGDGQSIVGRRVFEFDPEYRTARNTREILDVIRSGQPVTFMTDEGRAAKKVGRVIKTTLTPTRRGVLCCSHEVTELAKARDKAIGEAERLKLACDHALHTILLSDHNGTVTYVNSALEELLGCRSSDLVGHNCRKLLGRPSLPAEEELLKEVARNGSFKNVHECELVSAAGETILTSIAINSAFLAGQTEPVHIAHIQDIRPERRRVAELNDALGRAEEATRLKSQFLANMSHEIRTPLNGVLGMAQILAQDSLTDVQAENVSIILESGRALMSLLNDVLDLSKIEAGKFELSPHPIDVRQKLNSIFRLHKPSAEEKDLSFRLFIDDSVPAYLILDCIRLRQCVSNLISNAIKFTARGEVLIAVKADPRSHGYSDLTVHVSDTGCGIPEDKVDHIFASFSQADGSITRKFGGTGLGLSISQSLARLMGGDITVVSEAERGSVFTLRIPAEIAEYKGREAASPNASFSSGGNEQKPDRSFAHKSAI